MITKDAKTAESIPEGLRDVIAYVQSFQGGKHLPYELAG